MSKKKLSKLLALYLPYVVIGLVATNLGEAWRLAVGKELGDKIVSLMDTLPAVFSNPLPSLHPFDLFIGLCCGAGMRLAVYLKGKNAKKYRHGMEYGSARWGTPKDIEPFMAPKFADNIILTKTERLMMSNRPPDPKNARNKNVLVVGGSGSGKTRFWLKPNLLQCHSSYVVTDPKGSIVIECGNALMKNKIIGVCPNCGANVVEREKGWFCENRECRFVLWKDNAFFKRLGKRLDGRMADKLLRDGRVRLKDCKSAKGKTYNATVLLSCEADGRSKFSLEFEGGC